VLSVVVPAYNAGAYITTTLDSLLQDGVLDVEIVICDDGSDDDTANIIRNYAARDRRISLLAQANAGAAAARNNAFSASRGSAILYFDADDVLRPGSLRALSVMAHRYPNDIIYSPWAKFGEDLNRLQHGSRLLTEDLPGCDWLIHAFLYDYPTYPGGFVLPRSSIEQYGGWDVRLTFQDDMEFYARHISRAKLMRYCPDSLFCYREQVPNSYSKKAGRASSESQWLATRLAAEHLLSVCTKPRARAAAFRQLMLVSFTQYMFARDISEKAERLARKVGGWRRWLPYCPRLPGGFRRRALQVLFGWKRALRLHARLRALR
jgi:glycosyltransferase involved in cell wall biosynthesis